MNWQKLNSEQRKYIAILILLTLVGIICLLLSKPNEKNESLGAVQTAEVLAVKEEKKESMLEPEKELASILAAIDGVGQVWVKITWDGSETTEYAYDEQQTEKLSYAESGEQSAQPANQEVQQNKTLALISKGQGNTEPIVVKKMNPEIVGVLVVAQGANNPLVEEKLMQAVATLLGVATHKVVIMAADGEEN